MNSNISSKRLSRLETTTLFGAAFAIGLGLTLYHLAGFAVCLAELGAKKVLHATLASSIALPVLGIVHIKILGRRTEGQSVFYTFGFLVLIATVLWIMSWYLGSMVAPYTVLFAKILGPFCFLSFMRVLQSELPGTRNSGTRLIVMAGFPSSQFAGGCLAPIVFDQTGYFHGSELGVFFIFIGGLLVFVCAQTRQSPEIAIKARKDSDQGNIEQSGHKSKQLPTMWIVVLAVTITLASSLTGHIYSQAANSFSADPAKLTKTLSFVDAISGIIQLLAMTCLGGRLLRCLGAGKCLLMLPALLFACGVGFVGFSGVGLSTTEVFWMAAVAWVGESVGKSAFHHPAMGVLMDSVYDSQARNRLNSILETSVRPLSKVAAGSALVFLSDSNGGIQLLLTAWMVILAVWLATAYRLSRFATTREKAC